MTYPLTTSSKNNQSDRWETKKLPSLIGGMNTQSTPEALPLNQSQLVKNLYIYKSELRHDTGYARLDASTSALLDSMPRRTIQYETSTGAKELICITKGSVYKYNTTHREWQYVKGTTSTLLNGAAVATTTSIVVDSSAGFLAGEKIGIHLTNGKQYRTTVDSIPDGTHINIPAPGLPSGASDNAVLVRAVHLTGNEVDPVMAINMPGSAWLVFTNNVDYVKRYNGTDCVDVPGLTTTTCRSLVLYNSALVLLNTTEGGTNYPTRVRRSEIAVPSTWSGGTAGYDDLLDTAGEIVGGDRLGPYLIVYKSRAVYRGSFVNTGGKYYNYDPMVYGDAADGLVATDGLVNTGVSHIVYGNANIYEYLGDFSLRPIADALFYELFSSDAPIKSSLIDQAFGAFVEGLQEVWMFTASTSASYPDTMWRYSLGNKSWIKRNFANTFVSAGLYQSQASAPTWADLVGTWSAQVWTWDSRLLIASTPNILLCPSTGSLVYSYDFISTLDNATSVSAVLETRDFVWDGGELRTDRIDLRIQGLSIQVEYSVDEGVTWVAWEIFSASEMATVQSHKQVVAHSIRFRFTCADPNFRIRWLNLVWRPESVV